MFGRWRQHRSPPGADPTNRQAPETGVSQDRSARRVLLPDSVSCSPGFLVPRQSFVELIADDVIVTKINEGRCLERRVPGIGVVVQDSECFEQRLLAARTRTDVRGTPPPGKVGGGV